MARRLALECLEQKRLLTVADAPSGLVSWWTADDTAADLTSRNHATLAEGSYAIGMVGKAFDFDGRNDRVLVSDSESLKLTRSLSIEAWISVREYPANSHGLILFRGDDRGGLDPYSLTSLPDGRIRFQVSSEASGSASVFASVPPNQFTHVAGTLDDATGAMRIYVNGALVQEIVTSIRAFGDLDPDSYPGIGIGNHGGGSSSPHNFPFNGLIDELSVYRRALTSDEVRGLFQAGSDGKTQMFVTKTDPEFNAVVAEPPTSFSVEFNEPYNEASIQASDFQVNGIAADSFAISAGDTVTFQYESSPVVAEGVQTMHVDRDAISSQRDGLSLGRYDATFRYDSVPMAVLATNPPVESPLEVSLADFSTTAVLSSAGMKGGNGGWPVLFGPDAVSGSHLQLAIDEDQKRDDERSHTTEEVAVFAFSDVPSADVAPYLVTGEVSAVSNEGWTSVNLDRTYTSMVVIATPVYSDASVPLVTRIQNAEGDGFQVKVQRADNSAARVSNVTVHYVVLEEGVYTTAEHGVKLESVRFTSTMTDNQSSWSGEERSYLNPSGYERPVVLGQVLTINDPDFSVFWASQGARQQPPSSSELKVGKHVGEDEDTSRANETIGYVVIDAGTGAIGGKEYAAYVGDNSIRGIDNEIPFSYQSSFAAIRLQLNEAVDPATVDLSDLVLSQGTVVDARIVNATTIEYQLQGVSESDQTIDVREGALSDLSGNPISAFSASYLADQNTLLASDLPQVIPDEGTLTSSIAVSDLGRVIDANVKLSIDHTFVSDLSAHLIGPDGTRAELFANVAGDGFNFTNTLFDDQAEVAIEDGRPPFTGSYRPRGLLSDFRGKDATGVWSLEVSDREALDQGILVSWSLELATGGRPLAALPGDANHDGRLDFMDIDALYLAIAAGSDEPSFDLIADKMVDEVDVEILVEDLLRTRKGDANLDRRVDFADFLRLSANFGQGPRSWEHGDFDGDGDVDFADFLTLSANFGFDSNDAPL